MTQVLHEVAPGVRCLPVLTPTLPPATHTNVVVLGADRLTVVDPASPWPEEQARLARALDEVGDVERIVLTHHHEDHVGGTEALRAHQRTRGRDVPVLAHRITAERLRGEIAVDMLLDEGDPLACDGVDVRCLHTPGHAPGHLVLHDARHGTMVAGDMVAGIGTILIEPVDGDLGLYLASLQRMAALGPKVLVPSHGPVLHEARTVLGFYVAHRHHRTEQIREVLDRMGTATADAIAPQVYPELPMHALPVASVQVTSHLIWMVRNGLAVDAGGGRYRRVG